MKVYFLFYVKDEYSSETKHSNVAAVDRNIVRFITISHLQIYDPKKVAGYLDSAAITSTFSTLINYCSQNLVVVAHTLPFSIKICTFFKHTHGSMVKISWNIFIISEMYRFIGFSLDFPTRTAFLKSSPRLRNCGYRNGCLVTPQRNVR